MSERCNYCGCVHDDESRWYWGRDLVCEDCYDALWQGELHKWNLFRLQVSLVVAAVMVATVVGVVWWLVG